MVVRFWGLKCYGEWGSDKGLSPLGSRDEGSFVTVKLDPLPFWVGYLYHGTPGEGWTHAEPKDLGLDVGKKYELPRREDPSREEPRHRKSDEDTAFLCEEQQQQEGADQSPLTDKLLPTGENITDVLDYNVDPEVIAAIANIPPMDDIEMQDVNPPPGFDLEVGCTGYNHNLVWTAGEGAPGSSSPVTEQENRMLGEDTQLKTPGNGWSGCDRNTSWPITNWK